MLSRNCQNAVCSCNSNLRHADMKVSVLAEILEEKQTSPGNYYECTNKAANNLIFQGVKLHKNKNKTHPHSDPNKFYKQLKMFIEEWLLSNSYFGNWTYTLDPTSWPEFVAITFGVKEIRNLAKRLQLNQSQSMDSGII